MDSHWVGKILPALGCLLVMFSPLVRAQGELKPYTGSALPAFTLTDLQGRTHSLSDYRGQVVVVNFWATWCLPCVREMPSMQRLKDRLADKPFTILAVNMAEAEGDIETFLHKIKVDFPILMDKEGDVRKAWHVFAFPTSFVLDTEGSIRYAWFGALEWDEPGVTRQISSMLPPDEFPDF